MISSNKPTIQKVRSSPPCRPTQHENQCKHSSSTFKFKCSFKKKQLFFVGKEKCPSPWVCCQPKTGGPGAIQVRDSSGTFERPGQVCASLLPEQSWSLKLDQGQTPILPGTGHAASKHTHCNVVWISLSF